MKAINCEKSKNSTPEAVKRLWLLFLMVLPVASFGLGLYLIERTRSDRPYQYNLVRSSSGTVTLELGREISFYQQRIRQNPDGGLDRASLATAYLKMARASGDVSWYLMAEQAAQESLAKLPFDNQEAVLALAKVNEARHNFAQAIQLAQKAPSDSALGILVTSNLAIGKVDKANQAAEALVKGVPTLGSLTLHALAKVAQGKDKEAMQNLQQAIAIEEPGETGSSVWARTLLGRLYYKQGQLEQARTLYQEVLKITPQYAPALLNQAQLEIRLGNYQAAEKLYSQFFQLVNKSPTVYDHVVLRGMARAQELQGNFLAAKKWRSQAEARLREDLVGFGHRKELAQLLLEDYRSETVAEALNLMQKELGDRRDAETLATLALALSRSGRWQEAQQAMNQARRWSIRDAGIFYQSGMIERQLGNTSQANKFFQLAQKIDPQFDAQAQKALGLGVGLGVN
ncbi:MAG: tetratricopeptide repeat protein [Chroococcus sp. CMT-3BRIN-NPC107]|jgi:tetratricopeptide (TPR) repeat protein|nr:tetratricopeptide repeat protein [Chroococcus sp. CMT-3BRIN-NPC107]